MTSCKRSLVLFLFVLPVLLAGPQGRASAFGGPLEVRNSLPLFLSAGSPLLLSAECGDSLSFDLAYSSTYVVGSSPHWSFNIDLEASVLHIAVRKLLGPSTELSLDVPVISYNSGVLDGFLDAYHSAFGFPDYGRSERPRNDFLLKVYRDGAAVVLGRPGEAALGDVRVGIKKALSAGDPYMSFYGFVEFPSGDPERGYGNGTLDGSVALLVDKALSDDVMSYLNAGAVFTGDYRGKDVTVSLRDYLYGAVGVEKLLPGAFSFNVQLFVQGSPFGETGVRAMDEVAAVLSLGGRYRMDGKSDLDFSFSEDLSTAGAPDFMVALSWRRAF